MIKFCEYNSVVKYNIHSQMKCLKNWHLPSQRKTALQLGEALKIIDRRQGAMLALTFPATIKHVTK